MVDGTQYLIAVLSCVAMGIIGPGIEWPPRKASAAVVDGMQPTPRPDEFVWIRVKPGIEIRRLDDVVDELAEVVPPAVEPEMPTVPVVPAPAVVVPPSVTAPAPVVFQNACPGGVCPTGRQQPAQRQRGLLRRLFRRG